MRLRKTVPAIGILCLVLAGCNQPQAESTAAPAPASPEFRPTGTIQDIMLSVVDPSADAVWNSVATIVDAEGMHENYPKTDEDWANVRIDAVRLMEASNLLLVPGRSVARPGHVSEFPGIELEPAEVQELIDSDRQKWTTLAHGLHDEAVKTLEAVENKDVEGLQKAGAMLDVACERCHLEYWYPNDSEARKIFEEQLEMLEEINATEQ